MLFNIRKRKTRRLTITYKLSEHIALRSWWLVPYAFYIKGQKNAIGLKKDEYELLCRCDGQQELPESKLLQELLERGLITTCKPGEQLSEWQKPKACDNRYVPAMIWMITGKCNYNCLHCFNAADNNQLQTEFSWEECVRLMDEAKRCGVNAINLTGGEPMLHPHFMDIIRGIHERGMYVRGIITNGSLLTQEILDELKRIGSNPMIKISYDGIGHHDWLRNHSGAEQDAMRAIKLCLDNGFSVRVHMNVHRMNVDTMLPTAKLLDEMGVQEMWIIRTSESPRWVENAGDACLGLTEYYDRMLEFTEAYIQEQHQMSIELWQFLSLYPQQRSYSCRPVQCAHGEYRDSLPVCGGNRSMVAVTAGGNVVPCVQMSGYYEKEGAILGNVKRDGLHKLLRSGSYLDTVCTTVGMLKEKNETCRNCPYFPYCAGGCRAIALALSGDYMASDPAKCLYFKNGYLEKTEKLLKNFRNQTPVSISSETKEN